MFTRPLSPWTAAPFAIIIWLLSGFVPMGILVLVLFAGAAAFVSPMYSFSYEKNSKGGISFTWTYKDWIGIAVILCVVVALVKGMDPVAILKIITQGKGMR
jgi:hypothetical protein